MHVDKDTNLAWYGHYLKFVTHFIYWLNYYLSVRIRDILLSAEGPLFKRSGVESVFPLVDSFSKHFEYISDTSYIFKLSPTLLACSTFDSMCVYIYICILYMCIYV